MPFESKAVLLAQSTRPVRGSDDPA